MKASLLALVAVVICGGCVLNGGQQRSTALCRIEGDARSARAAPIVIVLMAGDESHGWRLADHYVLQAPGDWRFAVRAGTYRIAAFADVSRDLVYQPGEPLVASDAADPIRCASGDLNLVPIDIPASTPDVIEGIVDMPAQQTAQRPDIVPLDDPRFAAAAVSVGTHSGIYFLEPYDPHKIPVLFVHGINGTPRQFTELIEGLDRDRFQPWVYSYASGDHLATIADHLTQAVQKIELQLDIDALIVVAHSMGGLVARDFILRSRQLDPALRIPLFVSVSTPWAGHAAAEIGLRYAPTVMNVWHDIVPGSEYLRGLFAKPLPSGTPHYLLFTYNRRHSSFGASNDHKVTVASQLYPAAQQQATRVIGFDTTHVGVLRDRAVSVLLNDLLGDGPGARQAQATLDLHP